MTDSASQALGIGIALLAASCAAPREMTDARAQILSLDAEWSRLASEGVDVERVASVWADDAVILPPGRAAITGHDAIREFVAESFATPGFNITWKTTDVVVAQSGDIAYSRGTNRVTVDGADGAQIVINGKSTAVWRKDTKGAWKCVLDIWNDDASTASR